MQSLPPGGAGGEGVEDPRAWFDLFTRGPSDASRILAYVNAVLAGVVALFFALGFIVRIHCRRLRWLYRDGALTRPDFQLVLPAIWGVFSTFFIALHAYATTLTSGQVTWTTFLAAWYITQSSIALASMSACLSWLARVPSIRRVAEKYAARRIARRERIYPTRVFAALYIGWIGLFFASILPMMVIHLRGIGEVFNMLDSIMAEYSQFEQTGDLLLGLKIMQDATAARAKAIYISLTVSRWTTGVFCFWSFGWAICIAVSAWSLRRSIEVCIASFPGNIALSRVFRGSSNDARPSVPAETRVASYIKPAPNPTIAMEPAFPPIPALRNKSSSDTTTTTTAIGLPPDSPLKSGWYSDLPVDRPFGNIPLRTAAPTHPRHFQVILDARTISATEKSKQLRAMLTRDAILSGLLLVVVLSLAANAIYLAKATFNFSPGNDPQKLLLIHYVWGSYAYLLPAFIASLNFLYESLKLSKLSKQSGSNHLPRSKTTGKSSNSDSSPEAPITFSIPLVATTAGVGVQQSMEVREEYMKSDELDDEGESTAGKAPHRYT